MNEKSIERAILDYLSTFKDGFAMKINVGGKPIKKGNSVVMIPFQNPYTAKGMSDIFFIYKGLFFAFEVKKPEEKRHIEKHYRQYSKDDPGMFANKTQKRFAQQVQFIERVRLGGGYGLVVDSVDDVANYLRRLGLVK